MKTKYQELYEYLTPTMVTGTITTDQIAHVLATVKLLEERVKFYEKYSFELYAESKREDLAQESEHEMRCEKISGEGDE